MKHFAIVAAAALTFGSVGYFGCDRDETPSTPSGTKPKETAGEKVDRAMDRAGEVAGEATDKTIEAGKDAGAAVSDVARRAGDELREGVGEGTAAAPDAEDIRDLVASVTEAALTENGLDDVTEGLVDADRNRIGDAVEADFPDHAALVKQFRADWKTKYGGEFNIKDEEAALPDTLFTVQQGEIGEGAAGAEVEVDREADGSTTVDVDRKSGVDSPDTAAADANRNDPGRNIATVSIKAAHGLPALSVPLIHEAPDNWRIDVPDSLDGNKLKENVLAHLQAAHGMKAKWPENVQDAYGAVSHHVLMALLDKPAK